MITFRKEFEQKLPQGMTLDPALGTQLDWIEAQGQVYSIPQSSKRYASPYPQDPSGTEHPSVTFAPTDSDHARLWLGQDDPAVHQRLAPIISSGWDGSAIALWRAPDEIQFIVHMGSGSGSTMAGVMMRDPVDLIRLLSIGYDELCWPEQYSFTPAQVRKNEDQSDNFIVPQHFRNWVAETFGGPVPLTANAIVGRMGDMDGDPGSDPFLQWLAEMNR